MQQEETLSLNQGSFSLKITRKPEDVRKAQELRYKVFFEEMSGRSSNNNKIDEDEYDPICDHMIAYDNLENNLKVVGTYRFLRYEFIKNVKKFYTETEFDISKLLEHYKGNIVEVGRSCIAPDYRKGPVIKLLWRGIAMYLEKYNLDLLFGCASFPGDDPNKHAVLLSYLHHFHRIQDDLAPTPLESMKAKFTLIPKEDIDKKRTFAALPPLIKGYIRLGGKVGNGAVIDHNVNTTDVCVIVKKEDISKRYMDFLTPEL